MLASLADDVTTHRIEPDNAIYHGKEGFLDAVAEWAEDFEDWTVIPEEFLDAGGEVLVRIHQPMRGRGSGVPVEGDSWFLFAVGEGKIQRLTIHAREAEALEAAGLSE
jgi:hypothetical protein